MHIKQHEFQKGKSTESAISNTVHKIEKHIVNGEHCMGDFLDIQAVFDSITPEHIKRALLKHGCHPDMVDWYYELITHRNLESTSLKLQQIWVSHKEGYAVQKFGL